MTSAILISKIQHVQLPSHGKVKFITHMTRLIPRTRPAFCRFQLRFTVLQVMEAGRGLGTRLTYDHRASESFVLSNEVVGV